MTFVALAFSGKVLLSFERTIFHVREQMKKSGLAVIAFGFLALAACGQKNQDQLNQADVNAADNLDMLANDAANQASEQDVLQNQQEQLNNAATDNAAGPKTAADENIQGM